MAKEVSKTYSLTVKFRYDTGEDISESDTNFEVLRKEIKERLDDIFPISKGNLNAQASGLVRED